MEDGIENYTSMLSENEKKKEKSDNSRLYIYVPDNIAIDELLSNLIISDKKEKLEDIIGKKNGKIIVFADKQIFYSGVYSKL